jgi:hypothetical protein
MPARGGGTVVKKIFAALLCAAAAAVFSQEGGGWTEKPLAFSAFYTCTARVLREDGGVERYLENSLDEIRPRGIRLLHDGPYSSREIVVAFTTRGGEAVTIHFYFSDFQHGTYTLETVAEPYSFVLFRNCGGDFRMYPLEGNSSTFEFVLYNEAGRTGDNIYAAFDVDSSLLYF